MYFLRKWAGVKPFTHTGCFCQHPHVKAYFRCVGYKGCKAQFPTPRSSEDNFLLPFPEAEIVEREIEEAKKNQHRETLGLGKPRLEECADSLVNWDHLLNVNPT